MADAITTKNITSVDEVQSVDNTDKVFVNDNGSFKQISVSNLMKQAPSGVTEETDPTVSEWAKQPTKPSYTADEVGALPVGTKIPTKTSDLTNDSGYLTQIPEEYVTETELGQKGYVIEDDIPEKLPSPGILTFTGAVNDTYDGSANKTINIPTGGGEGGTSDYNALANKPKLNGVEIAGNKTSTDYKIVSSEQGIENNGKFLGVGVDGNVTLVDKPTYTADEVGARPDTWTPSAEDVGALPNNTEIPSKTSDLENDSGFITNSDIPEKLPNPQKIIFTGAVSAEYDGSSQQTINIPTDGGSDPYTLPIMSSTQLGGGKAVEKTDEDVPVAVDLETGQLFVPTYPENTGGGGGTVDPEQIKQAVNGYLEENPVSGMTAEQKQQLEQNTQDITDLKSALPDKLDSNQGVENKGKSMVVGEDGGLVPEDVKVPVDNTLSNEGEAADAKATGEELSKKVDVEKEINPEWEKWSDVRYNYGFDKNIQPIFNTIKGILETDTMISVRGGKGRWNKTDKPASEFVSGGHVFEGWSGKELARLTMLIGKFHEMFACIQTYSPAGLYQSTRRFGWVKLGSDEKNKGFDFSQGWSTCYTPLTFQPLSRPTTVMDYDLNPQFTLSTVPIGTLYYDQGENRFNVFTSNGWKSIAFTDDINNSNKEPTEPFSGNIEYVTMYPRKEDGIISNDALSPYSAWFPVETSKSYKVTRSELTDKFRIYLYNSEDLDSAFSSKEPGFLAVEDANNNVLDSLVFTNNNTYKFALVLLDNEQYYSKSVTISVLTSKN